MTTWKFKHPPRGTCEPKCPMYGRCHDGCGGRTRLATTTDSLDGVRIGQPSVFLRGHNLAPGAYTRTGIPVERVLPLVAWLHSHYGSWRRLEAAVGIPNKSLRRIRSQHAVTRSTANRLVGTVLAHRRPRDPFRLYELDEPPRLAKPTRREWSTYGLFRTPDRAKTLAHRIVRHLGGYSLAARALADYYDLTPKSAERMLHRLRKGEKKVRQGTIDHLEDFLEYIEREVEKVA